MTLAADQMRSADTAPLHRHNAGLEYLRFALAFAVVIYHYFYYGPFVGSMPLAPNAESGMVYLRFAVSAFFIISGFVIARSSHGKTWAAFVASRISRLLPAIFVCATLTLIMSLLVQRVGFQDTVEAYAISASLFPLLWSDTYIDGSYWSISYELRFYLLVLILIAVSALKWVPEILALIGVAVFAAAEIGGGAYLNLLMYPHIGFFAIGVLLHRFVSSGIGARDVGLWIVHLGLAIRGTDVSFERVDMFDGVRSGIITSVVVVAVCILLVVLSLSLGDFLANRQFPTTLSAALGGVSYPLYLIHQQFGYDVVGALSGVLPVMPSLVVATFLSVGIAFAVHLGVERKTARPLRRRIESALSFRSSAS